MSESKIEIQTFSYPILFKIIFRYGNIIITPILLVYTISLVTVLEQKIILAFPLLINILLIYFLNRHYFKLYRIIPYKLEVDEEKITCSNFFLSAKEIIIFYKDISSLSGGIFENKLSGVMRVYDSKNNVSIGFYQRLDGASKLATILLSKVNREIYDTVLERIISGKQKVKK
jgi:hypothetical protein